ncbi:MAG: acyltransferase family protein [Vicinamibacterales bacterium]
MSSHRESAVDLKHEFIPGLTSVRAFAAFLVILGHYWVWLSPFQPEIRNLFRVDTGAIGMTTFFVLSGFVIHLTYARWFRDLSRIRATFLFAVARLARLYPLYVFFLVVVLVRTHGNLRLFFADDAFRDFVLTHLLGIQAWYPFTFEGRIVSNGPFHVSWSISTELFFYLVYPAIFFAIVRLRSVGWVRVAWVAFVVIAMLGLPRLSQFLLPYCQQFETRHGLQPADAGNTVWMWLVYVSPYFRLPEFILGALTAEIFMRSRNEGRRRSPVVGDTLVALAVTSIVALVFARHSLPHSGGLFVLSKSFLLAPPIAFLLFAIASYPSRASRALAAPSLVWLGEISYSLYLLHPLVPRMIDIPLNAYPLDFPALALLVTNWLIAGTLLLALSFGTYRLVEVPGRRAIRRLGQGLLPERWRDSSFGSTSIVR